MSIDGEDLMTCPVSTITPESYDALTAFQFYSDGILPVAGGWMDQPGHVMEEILIVRGAYLAARSEAMEESKGKKNR